MKIGPFNAGILIFATIVAAVCNVLCADNSLLETTVGSLRSFGIGILIGLASLLYFANFVTVGNFIKFSFEYWLAGSTCYLLLTLAATALVLARKEKLLSASHWISELTSSVLIKMAVLAELGIGIVIFAVLVKRFQDTRQR